MEIEHLELVPHWITECSGGFGCAKHVGKAAKQLAQLALETAMPAGTPGSAAFPQAAELLNNTVVDPPDVQRSATMILVDAGNPLGIGMLRMRQMPKTVLYETDSG